MKKVSFFAVCIILIGSVSIAMAAGPRGGRFGRNPATVGKGPGFLNANLTEEQSEKTKALRESLAKDTTPIRTEMIQKRAELKVLWLQDEPNAEEIKAKQKEMRVLKGQMEDRLTDFRLAFRAILTPDQRIRMLSGRSRFGNEMRFTKDRSFKRWRQGPR